jgi:glycosyltransferase involved in cell wall biosynthesis
LEAQARGLPILASSHCGEVVVDGSNGRLIEPITSGAIEELIRWSFASPSALQEMSQQAFQRAKQFTAVRSIDALLAAIAENS